jgi:hypothetical protein
MVRNIRRCMVLYRMRIWLNVDSTFMVGIYPSILRSWDKDKGVPHARAPPPPAGPWAWATRIKDPVLISYFRWDTYLLNGFPRPVTHIPDIIFSAARWLSPSYDSARMEPQESRCLRNPCSLENPARGVRQLGFWGALPRLLTSSSCWRSRDIVFVFFLMTLVGLLGTANLFLHRLLSMTSSNAPVRTPWLEVQVQVEPPMPSAWDPTHLLSYS